MRKQRSSEASSMGGAWCITVRFGELPENWETIQITCHHYSLVYQANFPASLLTDRS